MEDVAEAQHQSAIQADLGAVVRGTRRWLSSGRLQSPAGAYCGWLDAATGARAFEYPEITGYALTWLASWESLDDRELAAGGRAADWLVRRLASGERSARSGWDSDAVYTFDLGMIAAGLVSFGRCVRDGGYAEQGIAAARQLAGYVNTVRGIESIAPDGPPTSRASGWSTSGQPHLTKCVQALLLAGEREAARLLVDRTLDAQLLDGHFNTAPGEERVMLHPHIYTIEGLWIWGTACDDDRALECAREAVAWVWQHQLPSGGLPRWASGTERGREQSDVTSQAIRAAILLGVEPRGLEAAASRLATLARTDGDHGCALTYQPDAEEVHLNAWVSMFGGQAFRVLTEGPNALNWNTIV